MAPDYQDTIAAFTIGSETLYRHQHDQSTGLTTEDLIDRIKTFRSEANAKGLKQDVGTADSWNKFQKEDGAADAVIPYLDIV